MVEKQSIEITGLLEYSDYDKLPVWYLYTDKKEVIDLDIWSFNELGIKQFEGKAVFNKNYPNPFN